jgi:hypothetical protein
MILTRIINSFDPTKVTSIDKLDDDTESAKFCRSYKWREKYVSFMLSKLYHMQESAKMAC